jgi:hypothetical protein
VSCRSMNGRSQFWLAVSVSEAHLIPRDNLHDVESASPSRWSRYDGQVPGSRKNRPKERAPDVKLCLAFIVDPAGAIDPGGQAYSNLYSKEKRYS